jgi:hypothetical protein
MATTQPEETPTKPVEEKKPEEVVPEKAEEKPAVEEGEFMSRIYCLELPLSLLYADTLLPQRQSRSSPRRTRRKTRPTSPPTLPPPPKTLSPPSQLTRRPRTNPRKT